MDDRQLRWPADLPRQPVKRDWRDTLRNATDLALAGALMTLAALPVVTAGAAVGAASAAVAQWSENEKFPTARETLRRFGRGILPGIPPLLAVVAFAVLIRLNIHALTVGLVPGGRPLIWATLLLALAGAGFAGLTVVEFGRRGAEGWWAATRAAAQVTVTRPWALAATAGVLGLTVAIGYLIQAILVPILAGYTLLALHAVHRRLAAR